MTFEPATFLFADIARFTALTEAHGDQEAATLVADFCDAVKAELPASGGDHVKTIGAFPIPPRLSCWPCDGLIEATEPPLSASACTTGRR